MGHIVEVTVERPVDDGEIGVVLDARVGLIHPDLRVGANVAAAAPLKSNAGVCFQGMNLVGKGFRMTADEVRVAGYDVSQLPDVIKPYSNARAMMQGGEAMYVIDFFGLSDAEARAQHPALYQRVLDRVKPERDANNRESRRQKWWLFGETVGRLRRTWRDVPRMIITPETSAHRVFAFVDRPFCPDHKLYAVCSNDALLLGVLSTAMHKLWSISAGGRLGVGNDPTWTNTTCFLRFPFPDWHAVDKLGSDIVSRGAEYPADRVRRLGEQLDAHRKRQQAAHPGLTLTGLYNVLEALRRGEPLSPKERVIHEQGLVSVLRQIHDELDAAVLQAYGWSDLLPLLRVAHGNDVPADGQTREDAKRAFEEAVLERLVALNAERAAAEARGEVLWLRPEFQNPAAQRAPAQAEIDTAHDDDAADDAPAVAAAPALKAAPWPKEPVAQVRAVAEVLAASRTPMTVDDIAACFSSRGPWKKRLPALIDMLVAVGTVEPLDDGARWRARATKS